MTFRNFLKLIGGRKAAIYLGKLLQSYAKIPQSYSFMIFGTHGVGLNALLYFISLSKYKGGGVYPTAMCLLRNDKETLVHRAELITLRFYELNYAAFIERRFSKWGLTFDGGPKDLTWIRKNLTKTVPAISLVRDPIKTLIAAINYHYFWTLTNTKSNNNYINLSNMFFDYELKESFIVKQLDSVIGFTSNYKVLQDKISNHLFLDTSDLTLEGMNKIGNFLDIEIADFDYSLPINTPFQRVLPQTFIVDGISFYLSAFSGYFTHEPWPQYCKKDDLCYIETPYISELFPNQKLFLSTTAKQTIQKQTLNKLRSKIEQFLATTKDKIELYEVGKLTEADMLNFLNSHKQIKSIIQTKIEAETKDIFKYRPDLLSKWQYFNALMS